MTAAPRRWAADLLYTWFHVLGPDDWFASDERVDEMLRRKFERNLLSLWPRPAEEFLAGPEIALASILLFDQVPRNIYRGSRRAFAFDPLARTIAREALLKGHDSGLIVHERQFMAMPLMHSEFISDQNWSRDYQARNGTSETFAFARAHWRMIARFGRFPHRNDVLGRRSTPAEARAVAAGNAW